MRGDVERVLISRDRIAARVHELALQITEDHGRVVAGRGDAELTIVPILTGAMIFCADLIRHIPMAMKIGLLAVTSYPGRSIRTQGSRVIGEMLGDLRGRHVLLVDDVLDSGGTIRLVAGTLKDSGAADVRTCVLLRKDRTGAREVPVDYVGFDIPDEFVVGYGLDFDNYYRNLPDIVTLKREVVGKRVEKTA